MKVILKKGEIWLLNGGRRVRKREKEKRGEEDKSEVSG